LGDLGKTVTLFCGVDIPSYLQYLPGSSRVINELPRQFDLSIIIDTSSDSLLEQLDKTGSKGWLAARPSIIIDHHATPPNYQLWPVSSVATRRRFQRNRLRISRSTGVET